MKNKIIRACRGIRFVIARSAKRDVAISLSQWVTGDCFVASLLAMTKRGIPRQALIILTCLVVIACGCGGGGSGGSGEPAADEPQHTDLDEILSVPDESLKVENGTHLPSVLNGTFILVQIRTMSQTGQVLSDDAIDPSATITITASFSDPVDTFSATSNLISKDAISVTGLVSLDVTSERLIVKISESNTDSIVSGETYSLELGQTGATGFGISIEGTIGGEPVEQIYMFSKSY